MKRFLLFCAILFAFFAAAPGHAQTPMGHLFTCLTGGTTGCVDKVDAEDLSDGMFGLVVVSNVFYVYQYDADSTVADDGITAIRPDYYTTPTVPWSQGVWLLVGTTSRDVLPGAADTYSLGSATREWANLYLGDSAVIYGQNDQSATLTSSASLWTANNLGVTTQFKLPSSNADPTATAGYLRHDSTVSNHANGALRWHDGTAIRQIIDMVAATAEGCTDTQVVAYSATNDNFYCKDDAGGTGNVATDTIWDAAGDLVYGTGSNTGARLALGTAGQVLKVNAGLTAPEWSSTLNISGLSLGGIILGDDTPDASGEVGYSTNAFRFYGNSEDMIITFASNAWTFSSTTGITDLALGSINLGTAGNITGAIKVLPLSSSCTIGSDCDSTSVKVAYGGTILATAAITITLPEIVASPSATQVGVGASLCVVARDAGEALVVDPHANDSISLCNASACTKDAAGDSITITQAGGKICLVAVEEDNWMDMGTRGTWTAN